MEPWRRSSRRSDGSLTWTEFQAGPQLLEALNVGAADFGLVGEAPPIFAQAAGANIVYAGYEPASPKNEAIIVPRTIAIQERVADLAGKRVALNKGSNVNYPLVRALEANGLEYGDITPAYLAPADCARGVRARCGRRLGDLGSLLACSGRATPGAKIIVDGTGLAPNVSFYMAARPLPNRARMS